MPGVVTATIDALPAAVQAEHEASVQALLVEQAQVLDPRVLAQAARRITDTLNITDFALTKRTSVDDGTLLCGFHHREHPNLGWTCRMIDGTPHWTPPAWIDPTQTPRRNRVHDLVGV